MAEKPTWLAVIAAVIRDNQRRLLLQRALPGKPHEGMWEFPGGKVEDKEDPRVALRREVAEELALDLDEAAMKPAGFADQRGAEGIRSVVLILYDCPVWYGEPLAREGQAWGWFTPGEAAALPMSAMDRFLLERLEP